MSNSRYFIIPEIESEETPDLQDFLVIMPGQADDPNARVYRLATIISLFSQQINRNIPANSVELEDLSREVINFIIRCGQAASGEQPADPPEPTTPPASTQLPEAPPGIVPPPDLVVPEPNVQPIISTISPRPRITPPTEESKPVIYHPSQPQTFYLIERDRALLANWEASEDDGGSPITNFEVAIKEASSNTTIANLTWIDKGLAYSHLFENLVNGTEYIAYVRSKNIVGYSFAVEKRGQPIEGQSKPLTLTIEPSSNYYIHADRTNGFSEIWYSLRYSEVVGSLDINEVSVVGGTITSSRGSNNFFTVIVKPNSYTTPVKITVGVDAASTSLNKKIASAVESPAVPFRRSISNLAPPLKPQLIETDGGLIISWEEPDNVLSGYEKLTGYQISLDDVQYIDIPPDVFEHRISGLTNDQEVVVYLRSKSYLGYSESLQLRGTPHIPVEVIDVPNDALPGIPRNRSTHQDELGTLYYRWEAPLDDNYDGFEGRIDGGDWIRFDKNVREYQYKSSTRWNIVKFELRTYNSRGFSDTVEYAGAVTAFPDPLQNAAVEAGNGVIKVTFDELASTPLDNSIDTTGSGLLVYSSPQYVWIKIYKNDVLLAHIDSIGSPSYYQLENEVEHKVEVGSRTIQFESDVIHTFMVTPSSSHAADGTIGAVTGYTLTPGNNQLAGSWTAPTDDGGGDGIAFYEMEFSPRPPIVNISDADTRLKYIYQPFRVDGTSFTLTELITGTAYTVRVRSVHENGTFGQLLEHPPISRYVYGEWAEATGTPT